jgi:hypothetical protein
VAEGYKEPTTAAGHAKMAAEIKKMLDDTLADRGDRHGNPDPQRLASAYEYHTQKAKEKSQGVAEGSSDKVHLKTPKHGLADHPGRNTGVGLSTFAATSEQDRCPKCNSLYKNHYQKQGVAEGLGKDLKRLATGKDVKSRAGQEIAKSQDASMKGDDKTARKHFKRYDKLDTLANKGVAESFSDSRLVNLPGGDKNRPLPSSRPWTDEEKKKHRELDDARIRAEREKRKQQEKKQGVAASKDKSDKKS